LATACSSSTDAPATGTAADGGASSDSGTVAVTDSGAGTDSASAADSGTASCTAVTNVGTIVNKDHDPGAPPAMTGGAIVDGTYTLTKMVQYNGENGNTPHKETSVFAGGEGQIVGAKDGTGAEERVFFTYTTSGNELTLTLGCGASGTVKLLYTATATTITTVNQDDPNELHTSTKM
jgi:hypothetical protein